MTTAGRVRRPACPDGLDIVSHDVYAHGVPYEAFARLRRDAPVAWTDDPDDPGHGFWSVTCHADLVAVHKDWRTYSSEIGGTEIEELAPDALVARRTMLETDPPRHTRLRQLVNPPFARATVLRYEQDARAIVRSVIDDAATRTDVEFVHDVARELPIRMLCGILGVPAEEAPQLFEWADAIVYHADPDYSAAVVDRVDTDPYRLLPFRSPVSLKVFEWFERLARARRAAPAGDVITALSTAAVDGVPLTERELDTFFLLLLIAGNETTRHALSHGVRALAEHPEQLQRLRDDPSLLDSAVEEVLRWSCPQIHFRRTATVATELAGVPIDAGDRVVTWYVSANVDDAEFADPSAFDITRSPNRHVTFGGGGPHLCLGQWLARLEVRAFLEELVPRLHAVEVAAPPERVRSNFINGLQSLPLRWHVE